MKKILIYGLWVDIIAWCLLLNDYEILGILVASLVTVYTCYFTKNLNYWRIISIFLITNLVDYYLVTVSNIVSIYHFIFPFLLVMNLNTALSNEVCYKLKTRVIMPIYLILTASLIISLILALIIPNTPLLPFYKTNLLIYIFLIFFSTFIEQSICILSKSILTHKHIQKMYN